MKKSYTNHLISGFLLFSSLFLTFNASAQYNERLTITASGCAILPDIQADIPVYGLGIGLDGGLQLNLNKRFSFISSVRYYYAFGNQDYPDAFLNNLGIGAGIKLNLLPRKAVNPYLFAEANLNFLWYQDVVFYDPPIIDDFGTPIEFDYYPEQPLTAGGLGGLGFDINFGKNFTIFIQSGAYFTYYEQKIDLYSQAGIRINLFKSKFI